MQGRRIGAVDLTAELRGQFVGFAGDIAGCGRIGAHELFFDPTFDAGAKTLDQWLVLMEELRKLE